MGDQKIRLNKKQIAFVVYILEIEDVKQAVEKFAAIMMEERLHPSEMSNVIDRILSKQGPAKK